MFKLNFLIVVKYCYTSKHTNKTNRSASVKLYVGMASNLEELSTSNQTITQRVYGAELELNIEGFLNWLEFQGEDAKLRSKPINVKCGIKTLDFELQLHLGKKDEDDISIFLNSNILQDSYIKFNVKHITASEQILKVSALRRFVKESPIWGIKKGLSKKQLRDQASECLPGGALKIHCSFEINMFEHLTTSNEDIMLDNKSLSISNKFSKLWKKEVLIDFKLICENEAFLCHKIVLASMSDVFEAMFSHTDLAEGQKDEAVIKDCSPEVLTKFLEFLYTEDLEDNEGFNSKALLILSDRYNVVSLKKRCERTMAKGLNCSNAIGLLNLATTIPTPILLEKSARFVAKNHEKLKEEKEWSKMIEKNPQAMVAILKYGLPSISLT